MKSLSILLLNHNWFAEELRAMGHRVVTLGLGTKHQEINLRGSSVSVETVLQNLPADFIPERLVWLDDSGVPWLIGLENWDIPKVFLSIDSHHHLHWHKRFAQLFDLVLVAQRTHVEEFQASNADVLWFPPWSSREMQPETERPIDVAFRGTLDPKLHPKRAAFFEQLRKNVQIDAEAGDYTRSYPRAKIVVNQAVSNDLNFRVFEVLASGALLLTPNDQTGLGELFVPGVDLVTYQPNDAEDAAEKINFYLSHEEERKRIAASGYEKALAYHRALSRAETLHSRLLQLHSNSHSERAAEASYIYLFSYLVKKQVAEGVGDVNLLRGCLVAMLRYLRESKQPDETALMPMFVQIIEELPQPYKEEIVFEVLRELTNKFSSTRLLRIMLAAAAVEQGNAEILRAEAAALGMDAETLKENLPALLAMT